jgi:DeoR family glycerol-3-phosphate regulon repressor
MHANPRQSDILRTLQGRGSCSVSQIAEDLKVSTETIRRTIKPLVESGALIKFHGGVMVPDRIDETPYQRRMQLNAEAKRAVARMIAAEIRDGDSLILDNGTTTAHVADALADRASLVVVTPSADIACKLASRNGNRVFLAGGEVYPDDLSVFGPAVISFLQQFRVRYAILSVAGISLRGDLRNFRLSEAEFAKAAIGQADESWLVTDHSKFGRDAPVQVMELGKIDRLFTDRAPPKAIQALCARSKVKLRATV